MPTDQKIHIYYILGCCFQQNSIQVSPYTWNISVVASDSRYNHQPSTYHTTLSFPSTFLLTTDPTSGQSFNCQPAKASTNENGINTVTCISENNQNFVANFVLTSSKAINDTNPTFTTLSVDEDNCSILTTCNSENAISNSDVMIGSQVYPKWSIAVAAIAIAALLLALVTIIIKCSVNRQKAIGRILETNTEYSDYSRRPTEHSYMSQNEKAISRNGTMTSDQYVNDTDLGHDIHQYRRESNKMTYDRLSDIESAGSHIRTTGKLPSISSFRRLNLISSRTLLTSLPSIPSLPKLPSFNSMPFTLPNSSTFQNSILESEPFRPTTDSSFSDHISESTISVKGKMINTVNSRAAVEAHKVIRHASRKSKTRSTIFTEEHINKIFHLDDDAKHKSLAELYPQYGDTRSKSTSALGSMSAKTTTTSCPNSVRLKHREPKILEGMQAALIERSMSASNVIGAQSDGNESLEDEEAPFITLDHDELVLKTRNRSSSLTQQLRHACDDFGISRPKRHSGYSNRSVESRGRKRQSVCSVDAKRRSQSATPSAASTIRPRSFLLQRSVYDDDSSSSDDNSDTITRAKFQRRYRSLTQAGSQKYGSQKSGSPKRRSPPTSSMSNTSDVDTIRKHLQASWKAEITESPSHDSLNADSSMNIAPIKQRRPPLPEGFMRHRSDRFSRPTSMIEQIPEPEPPHDMTSQDSLATLSSFVPEHGYTSEDTESMSYSNAVSLAILQRDSISSGLSVLSIHKGKHETESSVCGLNETNSESNRSFHSQQSLSDLAIGDPRPSDVSFF
ncbi:hypothetical protein INT44_006678 [Umbelopsis vinacea]|uniref:Uncharacterized protein n=1 Tax=Umbelopsis vinacea TaxID=44442 RepID=A0A8H7U805_9FUNG|nr:hypothetical protein INT44_006678 [Umbelopsis vinacea]